MDYLTLKNKVLEKYFSRMNPMQRQAVFTIKGAVLIIAGAGTGKTTVICNRIANMLLFGNAYFSDNIRDITPEDEEFALSYLEGKIPDDMAAARLSQIFAEEKIEPWRILAVTFTNKAAGELKERLMSMGADAGGIWALTFHSACVRILRQDIEMLNMGYTKSFTIYDTDDTQRLIKNIMKELNISEKVITAKTIQNIISRAKDKLITPQRFSDKGTNGNDDIILTTAKQIYTEYQSRLEASNALDFDDIIMLTVKLFSECEESLTHWQNRFHYIMVDEYQDTNIAQYRLISLLAGKNGNLGVVGDEDQSIYAFRGATIKNILSFEEEFGAKVIKLEQNYRSTETILNAANAIISHNTQHKEKSLWSSLGEGDKIQLNRFENEYEEGKYIVDKISENKRQGKLFSRHVILYRNNAQSRNIEVALSKAGIPYCIIGGVRFFERKEVKDIVSYLSVINNNYDEMRFLRIVNEPTRGIGAATQEEIIRVAHGLGMSPVEVMLESEELPSLYKKSKVLVDIANRFKELESMTEDISDGGIIDEILDMFDYRTALEKEGIEGEVRLENIAELKSMMIHFAEENPDAGLSEFLERVALVSDMDNYDPDEDKVVLMTMHSAKGLEFDTVFIAGAEENLFPGYHSATDPFQLEEERRLCYVAVTRAKKNLYITCAKQRMIYGMTQRNKVSRFVTEIPPKYMEYKDKTAQQPGPSSYKPSKPRPGYLQSASSPVSKPSQNTGEYVTFAVGERVYHPLFKEGTILKVTPMGKDQFVEVSFDQNGTKKIAANFSKLKHI